MTELALYILDLVRNAIEAGANRVEIRVIISKQNDSLTIEIKDDGCGMSKYLLCHAVDPFTTTRTTRKIGLGLPMAHQLCETCGGKLEIKSEHGCGTTVKMTFCRSHVDLPPIGSLTDTMLALITTSPEIPDFFLYCSAGDEPYEFDTAAIREILGAIPLNNPEVISWMRTDLNDGLNVFR